MIKQGEYTFYDIQFCDHMKSPPMKPEGELKLVENPKWYFIDDTLITKVNPAVRTNSGFTFKLIDEMRQRREVKTETGNPGWWDISFAKTVLATLRNGNENGAFNHNDMYNSNQRAIRYKFRIIEIKQRYKLEIYNG